MRPKNREAKLNHSIDLVRFLFSKYNYSEFYWNFKK